MQLVTRSSPFFCPDESRSHLTVRKFSPQIRYLLSFLVRPLLPTHCRCTGLLSHLITLNNIHSVGFLFTNDLPVAETSDIQINQPIRCISLSAADCNSHGSVSWLHSMYFETIMDQSLDCLTRPTSRVLPSYWPRIIEVR